MGLKDILEDIQKDAATDYEETVARAKAEALRIQSDKESELEAYYDKERRNLDADLKKMKARLNARAELETLKSFQQSEKQISDSLIADSIHYTVSTLKNDTKAYQSYLSRLIKDSAQLLGAKEISVQMSKDDEPLLPALAKETGLKLTAGPSIKTMAGLICGSGKTCIDCTLETLFRGLEGDILRLIRDSMKS